MTKLCTYLALAKGDGIKLVPAESLVLRELEETSHWICSGREHKDERDGGVGVGIALGQVKWRRVHELLP